MKPSLNFFSSEDNLLSNFFPNSIFCDPGEYNLILVRDGVQHGGLSLAMPVTILDQITSVETSLLLMLFP